MTHSDVVVVGAGLAGLVATAELVAAGRRVTLLDAEPAASLGGQAFWSFGGLFLVDSPEQRRLGVKDSAELALADWFGSARLRRRRLRPLGPRVGRGVRRVRRRATCARGCTPRACAGSRSCSGPSAAATWPTGTATRCRGSTSRGAPARASSSRSSAPCSTAAARAWSTCGSGTGSPAWSPPTAAVTGVRGDVLAADAVERAVPSSARASGAVRAVRERRRRSRRGGIGANHDLVRAHVAARPPGTLPARMLSGVPDHVGRLRDRRRDGVGRRRGARGPHVALPRGHHQPLAGLERGTASASCRARVAVARRRRAPAARAAVPRLRLSRRAAAHHRARRRPLVVRARQDDPRVGVRAVRLGAEPGPDRQGREAAAGAGASRGAVGPVEAFAEKSRRVPLGGHPCGAGRQDERAVRHGPDRRRRPGAHDRRAATGRSSTGLGKDPQVVATAMARALRRRQAHPRRQAAPAARPRARPAARRPPVRADPQDPRRPAHRPRGPRAAPRRRGAAGAVGRRRGRRVRRRRRARPPRAGGHVPGRLPVHGRTTGRALGSASDARRARQPPECRGARDADGPAALPRAPATARSGERVRILGDQRGGVPKVVQVRAGRAPARLATRSWRVLADEDRRAGRRTPLRSASTAPSYSIRP